MNTVFDALWVEEQADGVFRRTVVQRAVDDLPPGELLIRVHFSSLNYKDALSANGNRGVTRKYPHTPGIDAAGVVVESAAAGFQPGDEVIVIGYDLGMNTPGGFGGYIRTPAAWAVQRPAGLTLRESMALGTAGFTAAQCVEALLAHDLGAGEVLVTGATGGVGSVAVALLSKLGRHVAAATGKPEEADYLHSLGAHTVIPRSEVDDASGKLLLRERWAGVVDTVGGNILATALKGTRYGGAVAACGNVASPALELTVYPFILRGVKLLGIDSVNPPIAARRALWARLAGEWKLAALAQLARETTLAGVNAEIDAMLLGQQRGRVVVAHANS
jgi:alcohol dehydrogenase